MAALYPRIPVPTKEKATRNWILTVERAPDDFVSLTYATRTEARNKRQELLDAAEVIVPRTGFKMGGQACQEPLQPPKTLADYREVVNRALAAGANGELTPGQVDQTVRLVRLGMKLLQMKEPDEDELAGLTELELLDRIFEQLTTSELLEMARERLDARAEAVAA